MLRWVIFITFYSALGFYALQGLRAASRFSWPYYLYLGVSLVVIGNFIFQFAYKEEQGRFLSIARSYALGFLLSIIAFNLVMIIFLFSEDIYRLIAGTYQKFFGVSKEFNIPSRRRFLSLIVLWVASLPFGALLYGMYKGKYNLEFDDLPSAFDGYQITQISDIHSGSFDNIEKITYAVNLINEQKSDALLFTGDMVNNKAEEMKPWSALFTTLDAKDGKFSVLGNHDYGDYVQWESDAAKKKNLKDLKDLQKEMGFNLLLNEHVYLEKMEIK